MRVQRNAASGKRVAQLVAEGVDVELSGRGDEPHLQVAGVAALAHDEVAQQALSACGGRRRPGPARRTSRARTLRTALLRSEASRQSRTSLTRSQRPRAWKPRARPPAGKPAGGSAEGRSPKCTPSCCGSARGSRPPRSAPARSPRGGRCGASASPTSSLLVLDLALVAQRLPGRAGALAALVVAAQRDAVRAGLEDLDRACVARSRASRASPRPARARRGTRPRRTRRSGPVRATPAPPCARLSTTSSSWSPRRGRAARLGAVFGR